MSIVMRTVMFKYLQMPITYYEYIQKLKEPENMVLIQLRMPKRLVEKLNIVAKVDEQTRSEVIRDAVREYLSELDWRWYEKEYEKILEDEEDDEDEEDEEGEEEREEEDEEVEE